MSTAGPKAVWEQERAEGHEKRIFRVTLSLGCSRKWSWGLRPRDDGSQKWRGRESARGDPGVSEPESGQVSGEQVSRWARPSGGRRASGKLNAHPEFSFSTPAGKRNL